MTVTPKPEEVLLSSVDSPVQLGKYTLLLRLASGGMGEVYVAHMAGAAGFQKRVVIKRILPQLAEEERYIRMFLDEARLTAQLNHPNICQVFELGALEGQYFLAMEFLEGAPLSRVLKLNPHRPGRSLDVRIATAVIAQACEGLAVAHELRDPETGSDGIVHRDVSPHNLFVTTAGLVKVLDFGVAKLYREGSQTLTATAKGKYLYMSPEQVRGRPLDPRSDLYSLGVVLFESLIGRHLYFRGSELDTLHAIDQGQRPRLRELRPDLTPELEEVIERALARDREQRFLSAREFARALTTVMRPLGGIASNHEIGEQIQELHGEEVAAQRAKIDHVTARLRSRGYLLTGPVDLVTPSEVNIAVLSPSKGHEASTYEIPTATSARLGLAVFDQSRPPIPGLTAAPAAAMTSAPATSILPMPPITTLTAASTESRAHPRWGASRGVWLLSAALVLIAALAAGAWVSRAVLMEYVAKREAQDRIATTTAPPGSEAPLPASNQTATPQPTSEAPADVAAPIGQTSKPGEAVDAGSAVDPAGEAKATGEAEAGDDTKAGDSTQTADRRSGSETESGSRSSRRSRRSRRDSKEQEGQTEAKETTSAGEQTRGIGYLSIDATPYAEIYINSRKIGLTPVIKTPLEAGEHAVKAVTKSGQVKRLTVKVVAGKTTMHRLAFD